MRTKSFGSRMSWRESRVRSKVVLFPCRVDENVVAIGFDPGDLVHSDEESAFALANQEAIGVAAFALHFLEQILQASFRAGTVGLSVVSAGTV